MKYDKHDVVIINRDDWQTKKNQAALAGILALFFFVCCFMYANKNLLLMDRIKEYQQSEKLYNEELNNCGKYVQELEAMIYKRNGV